jgi:hypothetical protein
MLLQKDWYIMMPIIMEFLIQLQKPIISNQIINVSPNEWKGISDINGTYIGKVRYRYQQYLELQHYK